MTPLSSETGLLHAVRNHLCGLHYHSGIRRQESNLLPLPVIETRLLTSTANSLANI